MISSSSSFSSFTVDLHQGELILVFIQALVIPYTIYHTTEQLVPILLVTHFHAVFYLYERMPKPSHEDVLVSINLLY